jgi:N-methylhydantoinase B/oxoprolinase/acetone carboxylase alpha subunit
MGRVPMFEQCLTHDGHTRRFRIKAIGGEGWEVREEQDSAVVRAKVYDDWHRVERARTVFEVEILQLTEQGWVLQSA